MYYLAQQYGRKKQLRFRAWLCLLLFSVMLFVIAVYFVTPTLLSSLLPRFSVAMASDVFSEALIERDDPTLTLEKDVIEQQQKQLVYSHKVQQGETLSEIFKLYGLEPNDLLAMIKTRPQAISVIKGQVVEWTQDDLGQLLSLQIHRNARLSSLYIKENNQFLFKPIVVQGSVKSLIKKGTVGRNFYQSARSVGLTNEQIQTIATALYWYVDITLPTVIGDKFSVELEQHVIGDQKLDSGKVMAIWYQHQGRDIQIVRFIDDNFYDIEGSSVQKSLNRSPFQRDYPISSGFNPHRLNPVTHHYAPHYGTDFATPIGTSVYATGDGVVMKVGRHPLAGKYVVLSHGRVYSTHFFHLSQLLVKAGDKVKLGQKIALTGNTGRSTGPHLHYELRQNGQPIDAMLAPLPQEQVIASSQRSDFMQLVKSKMSTLRDDI